MGSAKQWVLLVALVLLPNVGGWIGALMFDIDWYNKLDKAPINPPSWVFAPMWTLIYCLMGAASFLVCTEKGCFSAMALYAVQLVANWSWSFIFFRYHELFWSFVDMVFVDIAVIMTIISFIKVKPVAGILMVPCLAWLSVATYLNYYIYRHN